MASHERLEAWRLAHTPVLRIYEVSARWPPAERFGLTSQVRRAAVSIPTHISEGAGKRGAREFRRYLDIALGSMSEVTYLLRLGRDLNYLSAEEYEAIEETRNFAGMMLWRLYRSISRQC